RDAHLRLATEAQNKNDFSSYKENIGWYLNSRPDPAKKIIVEREYYQRLLDRGDVLPAHTEIMKHPADQRLQGELAPVTARLCDELVKRGDYARASTLLMKGAKFSEFKGFDLEWYYVRIGSGRPLSPDQWDALERAPSNERHYILSLLAL